MLLFFTLAYLIINVVVGFWASKKVKNTSDFALAGRNLSILVAGVSIFATWFGSETIMSSSGEFAKGGLLAVIKEPFGAVLCLFLIGWLFAKPLYRLNIVTFSDYFRLRFGKTAELISALFLVYSYFSWIAGQFKAMGGIMHTITATYGDWSISPEMGIVIGAVIIAAYTCVGGMWAVSYTDFIQTIVIVGGLIFLSVSLWNAAGGWQPIAAAQSEGFFDFTPQAGHVYEDPHLSSWWVYIAAWITLGLGSIPQQDVFQRTMSTRNEKSAAKSAYLSAFLYLTIALFPLFIGMAGKFLYPDLFNSDDIEGFLLVVLRSHAGLWLQILFYGALTSAIMSTASGAILAPATILTENLVRPIFPKLTDKSILRILRATVIGITVFSMISALSGASIYELNAETATITLVSLLTPLAFGVFWKRTSGIAAIGAMFIGFIVWVLVDEMIAAQYLSDEIPSLFHGFFASIASIIILSLLFPNKMPEPEPLVLGSELGEKEPDTLKKETAETVL